MEEEARQTGRPPQPMDTAEPSEADKPKGVFDWRERDGWQALGARRPGQDGPRRRKEQKLQAPGPPRMMVLVC